jgi:hypothetical protein
MTRAPGWPAAAARIGAHAGQAGFGLHLDFTEFAPQRRSLWPLIGASLARRLDPLQLRSEIAAQCALFEDVCGRVPDYVDGHQHVHQLPQIREALIEVLAARYAGRLPWLRISGARIGDGAKSLFIAALGAGALERLASSARMRSLPRLLGAYGFDGDDCGLPAAPCGLARPRGRGRCGHVPPGHAGTARRPDRCGPRARVRRAAHASAGTDGSDRNPSGHAASLTCRRPCDAMRNGTSAKGQVAGRQRAAYAVPDRPQGIDRAPEPESPALSRSVLGR